MKKQNLLWALLVLTACHSNPYDGQSNSNLSTQPVKQIATNPGFTIDAPAVVDVTEGSQAVDIPVTTHVISGSANVTFDGLPSFVTWDAANSKLVANAPVGSAVDPNKPNETTRKYEVSIKLSSSDSPNSFTTQTLVILVHHLAETLVVKNLDTQASILEGQNYQSSFQVQSRAFPQGPFYTQAVNLPDGVQISGTSDPTVFNITYRPGYAAVTPINSTTTCYDSHSQAHLCRNFNWTLNVIDPHGDSVSSTNSLSLLDVRKAPLIITSPTVAGSSSGASFDVQVEDPNGELAPSVTVTQSGFGMGNLSTTISASSNTGANGSLPYTLAHVNLRMTTATSKAGSSVTLTVKACVNDVDADPYNCVSQPVTVNF